MICRKRVKLMGRFRVNRVKVEQISSPIQSLRNKNKCRQFALKIQVNFSRKSEIYNLQDSIFPVMSFSP